ncbi:MAG: hypothetical protein KC983_03070 [Phycisphaerales bacterium]|nr:hypothetical protein [Phycisphaerales bacterium]
MTEAQPEITAEQTERGVPEIPLDVRLKRMTVDDLTTYATTQARQYREKKLKLKRLQEDITKAGKVLVVIQDELKRRDMKL